ncbi:hypothetical protein KIN20_026034 [Parelaphostrongylus tenuis]|uniref:Uncharacterized protein n=1 Tax=Parelaphostrongylus tenuis TaxID=148309 RepID=A0AAD5NDL1_PARTN|nr:hypothetical protein KIN20_026034 [Parelaphostrongylus tenuis]
MNGGLMTQAHIDIESDSAGTGWHQILLLLLCLSGSLDKWPPAIAPLLDTWIIG